MEICPHLDTHIYIYFFIYTIFFYRVFFFSHACRWVQWNWHHSVGVDLRWFPHFHKQKILLLLWQKFNASILHKRCRLSARSSGRLSQLSRLNNVRGADVFRILSVVPIMDGLCWFYWSRQSSASCTLLKMSLLPDLPSRVLVVTVVSSVTR